jgi:hypothetical protein
MNKNFFVGIIIFNKSESFAAVIKLYSSSDHNRVEFGYSGIKIKKAMKLSKPSEIFSIKNIISALLSMH